MYKEPTQYFQLAPTSLVCQYSKDKASLLTHFVAPESNKQSFIAKLNYIAWLLPVMAEMVNHLLLKEGHFISSEE